MKLSIFYSNYQLCLWPILLCVSNRANRVNASYEPIIFGLFKRCRITKILAFLLKMSWIAVALVSLELLFASPSFCIVSLFLIYMR